MSRRLAVVSQKGGVGKTTIALNLSLAFAESGRKTLLVDLDPQGGIAHSLAKQDAELPGVAELLVGAFEPEDVVVRTKVPGLGLLPRGRLDPIDVGAFETAIGSRGVLERMLASVEAGYDVTVVDTPSGLGVVARGVLAVADFVLLPFQAEPLALRSLVQALRVVDYVQGGENPRLELLGILPTMVERTKDPSHGVMMELWSHFDGVLETTVPRADVFAIASERGVPVGFLAGPPAPEARRFDVLARELADRMDRTSMEGRTHVERLERTLL